MSYDYIGTYMGHELNLKHPNKNDIDIFDIAYVISRINRFGHSIPYTVAQHSILVYELVKQKSQNTYEQLLALLHDSAEAYMGDLQTPIKDYMNALSSYNPYAILEWRLEDAILDKWGLMGNISNIEGMKTELIKEADELAWRLEAYNFLKPCVEYDNWDINQLPNKLKEYTYETPTIENTDIVESNFLRIFYHLRDKIRKPHTTQPLINIYEEKYINIWDRGRVIGRVRKLSNNKYFLEYLEGTDDYIPDMSQSFYKDDLKYLGPLKELIKRSW